MKTIVCFCDLLQSYQAHGNLDFTKPPSQIQFVSTESLPYINFLEACQFSANPPIKPRKVFVDVACISQYDPVLKKEGIVSIGGFLKKSKRLLVMWDETVMTRLWCVFELAAYLHSREGVKKTLTVSPAFVGATLLMAHLGFSVLVLTYTFALGRGPGGDPNPSGGSIFFPWGALVLCGLCFPCLTMFCSVLLEHCRSIDRVRQQVGNFTVQHAVSGCCAANHVTATGKPIMCDREIILRCVVGWFGSVSKFEANVQGELCGILVQQLYYDVFSYWRLVIVTSPIGWLMLDHWCGRFAQDGQLHAKMIIAMATAWLVFFPTLFLVILKLAHKLRNACQTRVKHLLVSMFLVLIGVGIFAAFVMGLALSEQLVEDEAGCFRKPQAMQFSLFCRTRTGDRHAGCPSTSISSDVLQRCFFTWSRHNVHKYVSQLHGPVYGRFHESRAPK